MIGDAEMLVLLLAPGVAPAAASQFLEDLRHLQTLPLAAPTARANGSWNLRLGPATTWPAVGDVLTGTLWELHSYNADWRLVRNLEHTLAGWVHMRAFEE